MEKYKKLVEPIKELLWEVSQEILEYYHADEETKNIQIKEDDSPLTAADLHSNKRITDWLKEKTPEIPIISEEFQNQSYEERQNYEYCWIIDPLDGTRRFVEKTDDFCINLALVKNEKVIMGFIFAPCMDLGYWAVKGEGAYKVIKNVEEKRIFSKPFSMNDEGLRIILSRSYQRPEKQQRIAGFLEYMATLNKPQMQFLGAAIKFGYIAEGLADIYPRLSPTNEWDLAAGQIIIEEAGGQMLHWDTKEPLKYNKPDTASPYFICMGNVKKE